MQRIKSEKPKIIRFCWTCSKLLHSTNHHVIREASIYRLKKWHKNRTMSQGQTFWSLFSPFWTYLEYKEHWHIQWWMPDVVYSRWKSNTIFAFPSSSNTNLICTIPRGIGWIDWSPFRQCHNKMWPKRMTKSSAIMFGGPRWHRLDWHLGP